jgi:uncharacterized protein
MVGRLRLRCQAVAVWAPVGDDGGVTTPAEPHLDEEERRQFDRGVDEFNRGFYFECHDTIEDLWSGLRGPSRDFFQGLIQVSVAFYHLGNGNLAGTASMMRRALKRFERYPGRYFGFDVAAQRAQLEAWLQRIADGEAARDGEPAPRWDVDRP